MWQNVVLLGHIEDDKKSHPPYLAKRKKKRGTLEGMYRLLIHHMKIMNLKLYVTIFGLG
jgi:hypothetical protein